MTVLEQVFQDLFLNRQPEPAESRVEEYLHPVKEGEFAGRIEKKMERQLREIERRRTRNKLDCRFIRMGRDHSAAGRHVRICSGGGNLE